MIGDAVDGVHEARCGHRSAVAEPEALPDEERVPATVLRDREPRRDLGDELAARPVVVELRRRRVFEPPALRHVGLLRVDLHRRANRPDLEDAAVSLGRRARELGRYEKRCSGRQHRRRQPQSSWHRSCLDERNQGQVSYI